MTKSVNSPPSKTPQPKKAEPVITLSDEQDAPANVAAYLDDCDKLKALAISSQQEKIELLKDKLFTAKVSAKPGINDTIEAAKKELQRIRRSHFEKYLKDQPNVGDIGFIEKAVTSKVLNETTAVVWIYNSDHIDTERSDGKVDDRRAKRGLVIVAGTSTAEMLAEQTWKETGMWTVTGTAQDDRSNRYVVLRSFDPAIVKEMRDQREVKKNIPETK